VLTNEKIKDLFNHLQAPLPSVRTTRRYVENLSSRINMEIQEKYKNMLIYLIFDETEINSIKHCNILAGDICLPHQSCITQKTYPLLKIYFKII